MKKYILKVAVWLPVIMILLFIFGFSSQDGEESGGLSRKAADILVSAAEKVDIVELDDSKRQQLIEDMQYPIRKLAHMTEYGVLATFVYIALAVDGLIWRFTGFAAVGMTFIFAGADEFHQTFVPGRCGAFSDVLIDMTGALIFIIVCTAIDRRRKNVL